RQVEFGKRVNEAVLEQQEAVITRALSVWGTYASERAAGRMEEWERSLEASAPGAAAPGASAVPGAASGAPTVPFGYRPPAFARDAATEPLGDRNPAFARFEATEPLDVRGARAVDAFGRDARAQNARGQNAGDTRDLTADLADLGFDTAADGAATAADAVDTAVLPASPAARTPMRPAPRTSDRAAFLRRAGLPDQL
ncbi:MAG: hypothetical protein Q7T55_02805, partial [Solirubrobacteraceae bacterium]|nr:hypothetical protein [Solirubrobacteraceae bacterium]